MQAVAPVPSRTRPAAPLACGAIASAAAASAASTSRAWVRSSAPAAVAAARRPTRSISFTPKRFSSWRTCRLTAGWVTPSRAAAPEKLFWSTTVAKVRS